MMSVNLHSFAKFSIDNFYPQTEKVIFAEQTQPELYIEWDCMEKGRKMSPKNYWIVRIVRFSRSRYVASLYLSVTSSVLSIIVWSVKTFFRPKLQLKATSGIGYLMGTTPTSAGQELTEI